MELAGLKVTMAGHSNRACRKLASASGLLINDFELQLLDCHRYYTVPMLSLALDWPGSRQQGGSERARARRYRDSYSAFSVG